MGTVPIVIHTPLDPLLQGLPVLLVEDYSNVTDSLIARYAETRAAGQTTQKAWALYWHLEIQRRKHVLVQS